MVFILFLLTPRPVLLSVIALQWMTSGDGPIVSASYPLQHPNSPRDGSHALRNGTRTTCKAQELYDLGRVLNQPESDIGTTRSRQVVVVSPSSSQDTDMKEGSVYSEATATAEGRNDGPTKILKTMCVTVESTRELGLTDVEAQTIHDKEDSG
jgi:hypothetical protein